MITSLGEVLIDMIAFEEGPLSRVSLFEKHPGGAPANVAVGLARLGIPVSLVSKVGADPFGSFLIEKLKEEGVDVSNILVDETKHTGIAFVQLSAAKPEFIIYDGVAYFNILPEELLRISPSELIHFGSVLLSRDPSKSSLFRYLKKAREQGTILSYDVNLRRDLWKDEHDMTKNIERAVRLADIIKLNESELYYLESHGIHVFDASLIAVTKGEEGCEIYHGNEHVHVPAYPVKPVDTTGAGDAFMAAILAWLWRKGLDLSLSREEMKEMGRFANKVAALSTQKKGAWSVPRGL